MHAFDVRRDASVALEWSSGGSMSDRGSGRFRGVSVETTLSLRSLSMIRERIAGIAVAGVTNS